jgi:acyl carrier protein
MSVSAIELTRIPARVAALGCAMMLLVISGAAVARSEMNLPCSYKDKACAWKAGRAHAAIKIETWKEAFARPLEDRIGPAPRGVVEFLHLGSIVDGSPSTPRAADPDPDFLVRETIKTIIARIASIDPESISDDALFVEQLGVDSLAALEISFEVEQQFHVTFTEHEGRQIKCLKDAVSLVTSKLAAS